MSFLGAFNTQLVRFFEGLTEIFPEERDIKASLEAINGLKKINPKMILELFYEHVYKGVNDALQRDDEEFVVVYARQTIEGQFNEMSAALTIFDKHWPTMTAANQKAIWNYMKVLCVLCDKARAARGAF